MYLRKLLFILAVLCLPIAAFSAPKPLVTTKVEFFSKTLELRFDPTMLQKNKLCTSHICLKKFYEKLEKTDYQVIIDDLLAHKEEMELNDWFFYKLVRKSVENIYQDQSDMYKTTVTWFIMTKLGFSTRLYTANNKYTFLYILTEDKVFEVSFIPIREKAYVNLTSIYFGLNTRRMIFDVGKYQPGKANDKPFSFKIDHFPNLPAQTITKQYEFEHDKKTISIEIEVDTIAQALIKNFPITMPYNYIKVPMTNTTMASLKKALKPHLDGKSLNDQVRLLASFTRKAFPYKSDQVRFQRDIPLTADQLMLADSSDFEDRCALFCNLLKETTDLNYVVVQYIHDDIITIGVELPEVIGKPFVHEGINYTICDPTMPGNSSKLGIYPINLHKDIEILDVVRSDQFEVQK